MWINKFYKKISIYLGAIFDCSFELNWESLEMLAIGASIDSDIIYTCLYIKRADLLCY